MKIRTITCHKPYNHGALLQAWALVRYLTSLGHDAKIIDYLPEYQRIHFKLRVNNPKYNRPIIRQLYMVAKIPGWLLSLRRKRAFDKFYQKKMQQFTIEPTYMSREELVANPPSADVYIAGSDQIWNPSFNNGHDKSFYLDFGSDSTRKISYAASFAHDSIPDNHKDFARRMLGGLNSISVRESSGVKIVSDLGFASAQVCDPVFLIDKGLWSNEIASSDGEGEKYILIYDFERNKGIEKTALRLATRNGWRIYSVGPYRLRYADANFNHLAPDAFVGLIKNSQCVISNSFHGTAFSLIFEKDFFVVKRSDGLNNRMTDFLARLNLNNRLIDVSATDTELNQHIDYSQVAPILNKEIEDSKKWITDNLK